MLKMRNERTTNDSMNLSSQNEILSFDENDVIGIPYIDQSSTKDQQDILLLSFYRVYIYLCLTYLIFDTSDVHVFE